MDKIGQNKEIGILAVIIILLLALGVFVVWFVGHQEDKKYVQLNGPQSLNVCVKPSAFQNGSYFLDPVCKETCDRFDSNIKGIKELGLWKVCVDETLFACVDSTYNYSQSDGTLCNFDKSQV